MRRLGAALLACLWGISLLAQSTGFPPYGSFHDGGFDAVNRQNLNINFAIPIVANPGRGMDFGFALTYNSLVWRRESTYWSPVDSKWGWNMELTLGSIPYDSWTELCVDYTIPYQEWVPYYTGYAYVSPDGTRHPFNVNFYDTSAQILDCGFPSGPRTGYATDGSGFYLDATYPTSPAVYDKSGHVITSGSLTDTNGNRITKVVVNANETHWKDTVGRIALKVKKNGAHWDYDYQDASGVYRAIHVEHETKNIKNDFQCSGVTDYTGSASLPIRVDLPNGQSYHFEYEPTPGYSGYVTGRLKKVTLPTGGHYEYTYEGSNNGTYCADGTPRKLVRSIVDPEPEPDAVATWIFDRTSTSVTKVTAPPLPYDTAGNEILFTFSGSLETQRKIYQGSSASESNLRRTINTTYSSGRPYSRTTILENGQQAKVETVFDSFDNLTELREFDFGGSTPVRTTQFTYETGSGYVAKNIRDRIKEQIVRQGGPTGTIVSRTKIFYDEYALVETLSGVPQNVSVSGVRGNPTSVIRYLTPATSGGAHTTTMKYDSVGNLRELTDPGGHKTTFSYVDNFVDNANQNSNAYLKQITKPTPFTSQTITFSYRYATGQQATSTNENSRVTTHTYGDVLRRLTQTDFPDGGQTAFAYNDSNRTVTTTVKRTGTDNLLYTDEYNALAQLVHRQLPGSRNLKFEYDPLGRLWRSYNPYVSTGDPTYGFVESKRDALGRTIAVINQDNTTAAQQFVGSATKITDESGKSRIFLSDGLGRVTRVCEITAGNTRSAAESCGISQFSGQSGYVTTAVYDVLDRPTQTSQGGQNRTYGYDGLGRRTTAGVVEVGTVTYEYDADGNLTKVTDPRGYSRYEYDQLHRLKKRAHKKSSDQSETVVATYEYDGTQANNAIGRLKTEWDGNLTGDKTDYEYDQVLRVKKQIRTVSGSAWSMLYTYDLMGNMVSLSYPSSSGTRRLVEYSYNANGELDRLRDMTGTFDYVQTGTTYGPLGALNTVTFGNGVRTTLGVNKRAQLTSINTRIPSSTVHLDLAYSYFDNGQIQQITNLLNSLKTEKYTYDELHRLLTAQRGPDQNIQRKYEYDFDRYGNRWGQILVAGSSPGGSTQHAYSSATNRITDTGFSYDTSGNLSQNGTGQATVAYDMENFTSSVGGTSIVYKIDARGRRVRKTVGSTVTDYFYLGAEIVAEKTGSDWTDYIFFGGVRVAKQTGSTASTATYLHTDHLGSVRVCTNSSGGTPQGGTCDYEPFGEEQSPCTDFPSNFRFAGMLWDADAELYHTWFRQYDPAQGRWMGVDKIDGGNRYMGVANDPVNLMDPLGLAECSFDIQFVNQAGLSDAQVALAQAQTNRLLSSVASPGGDTVSINFNFSGKPDTTLTIYRNASRFTNLFLRSPMGMTGAFTSPRVYLNNLGIEGHPPEFVAERVGSAGLHELAHYWLGGELAYDPRNLNTLMFERAPALAQGEAGTNPNHPLWKLSPKQIAALFKKCTKKHPQQTADASGGGGGGLFADPFFDPLPEIRVHCHPGIQAGELYIPGWCHYYSYGGGGWWPPLDMI